MKNYFIFLSLSLLSFNIHAQRSAVEKSGDILQIVLPAAALTSTFIWKDDQNGTAQFAKSLGLTLFTTFSLKRAINKPRPNGGKYSFPSGHTSSAFVGAAFLQKRHGWKVGIPAYILAGYVGGTRIYANKHDGWDVLGGAIVGIGSAYLFAKPLNHDKTNISLSEYQGAWIVNFSHRF